MNDYLPQLIERTWVGPVGIWPAVPGVFSSEEPLLADSKVPPPASSLGVFGSSTESATFGLSASSSLSSPQRISSQQPFIDASEVDLLVSESLSEQPALTVADIFSAVPSADRSGRAVMDMSSPHPQPFSRGEKGAGGSEGEEGRPRSFERGDFERRSSGQLSAGQVSSEQVLFEHQLSERMTPQIASEQVVPKQLISEQPGLDDSAVKTTSDRPILPNSAQSNRMAPPQEGSVISSNRTESDQVVKTDRTQSDLGIGSDSPGQDFCKVEITPTAAQPPVERPTTAQSSVAQPPVIQSSVAPTTAQPPVVQPIVAQLSSVIQPPAIRPSVIQPSVAQPSIAQSLVSQPQTSQPQTAHPDTSRLSGLPQPATPIEIDSNPKILESAAALHQKPTDEPPKAVVTRSSAINPTSQPSSETMNALLTANNLLAPSPLHLQAIRLQANRAQSLARSPAPTPPLQPQSPTHQPTLSLPQAIQPYTATTTEVNSLFTAVSKRSPTFPPHNKADAPPVKVTIGRIEVSVTAPEPSPKPSRRKQRQPSLSLQDYLKQRGGQSS